MIKTAREIEVDQGSDAWHQVRAGFISPSRFRTVVAGTHCGRNSYLDELSGRKPKPALNMNVASLNWGKYHEPLARCQYEFTKEVSVRVVGFYKHIELERVGGSPDGLVTCLDTGELGGCEIKCPYNPDVHEQTLKYGCPREHQYQVQGYMWLLDLPWWDFVSFDPRRIDVPSRLFIQRIVRDDYLQKAIDSKVRWFHELLLANKRVEVTDLNVLDVMRPPPKMFR